jgi:hypothetical protein
MRQEDGSAGLRQGSGQVEQGQASEADAQEEVALAAKKDVWDKPNPKKESKPLTTKQKSSAKAAAKKAGRKYPNLVDNMRAARGK